MVTHRTVLKIGVIAATLIAPNLAPKAFAENFSWQYIDARYQQPSDSKTKGFAGEVSGNISKNWVVQSRANRLQLKDNDLDLELSQTRIDLSVGRVFNLGSRTSALVSAGYTRLQYDLELSSFSEDYGDDAANAQVAFRAKLADRFDGEVSLGMLFDGDDTSDLLWNAAIRYRMYPNLSFTLGANGVDADNFDSDDVLYEIGFRFDLQDD